MKKQSKNNIIKLFLFYILIVNNLYSQTIKDISNIVGIRDNQLIGYGMVVGLPGTGDKSKFTMQSLQNLLRNSYIKIPTASINSKNIATVMVTATLPAFSKQGDKIKIKVASIGDAKSINGGKLLLTQLKGVNGKVYALAQGLVFSENENNRIGIIQAGGTIENEIDFNLDKEKDFTISLLEQNAEVAFKVENLINYYFNEQLARAMDTRTIKVNKPKNISPISFLYQIQKLELDTDIKKEIIIDLNRQIIVAGNDIEIKPVTITMEHFTIKFKQFGQTKEIFNNEFNQESFDLGDDLKVGKETTKINLNNALVNSFHKPTISDLMRSMKAMKLEIGDIIEVIRTLNELNAIDAKLKLI